MKNKFIPLGLSIVGTGLGYIISNPLVFDLCTRVYQFNNQIGCLDATIEYLGNPLFIFAFYALVPAIMAIFLPEKVYKTWAIFSLWFLPLALFFIAVIPPHAGGYFNPFPYEKHDAAHDAGRAFILLSLVTVLLKFYQLSGGYKKIFRL